MRILIAFALGALFGLGLYVGGMTDPGKVLGFLDVLGNWDPSLALVMGGAVSIGLVAFRIVSIKETRLAGCSIQPRWAQTIDRKLLLGATIFWHWLGPLRHLSGPSSFQPGAFRPPGRAVFLRNARGNGDGMGVTVLRHHRPPRGQTRWVGFSRPSRNSGEKRHDWQLLGFDARPPESERISHSRSPHQFQRPWRCTHPPPPRL